MYSSVAWTDRSLRRQETVHPPVQREDPCAPQALEAEASRWRWLAHEAEAQLATAPATRFGQDRHLETTAGPSQTPEAEPGYRSEWVTAAECTAL